MSRMAVLLVSVLLAGAAQAQDVVGIENCSAERSMERRTGCMQSNINYLHQLVMKTAAEGRQRLDTANQKLDTASREIDGLKAMVVKLQAAVDELQAAAKKADPKK